MLERDILLEQGVERRPVSYSSRKEIDRLCLKFNSEDKPENPMKTKSFINIILALLLPASSIIAQEDVAPPKSQRQTLNDLPLINVIDKLLAIEAVLNRTLRRSTEEEWIKDYEKLYQQFMRNGELSALPEGGKNEVYDCLALGIKGSDAVVALKARDVEAMNLSADQIEQIALKIGATRRELGMADTVKRYANKGQWFDAFLALGYLQRNVVSYLRSNPEKKPKAVLVIVGGWLQGGRCVTHYISENYNPALSNILREPKFVDMVKENMDDLPPAYLSDPMIMKIDKLLPEIRQRVNVGLHDPVKKEDVDWLYKTFNDLVMEIAPDGGAKKAGAKAAPAVPKAAPAATAIPKAMPVTP